MEGFGEDGRSEGASLGVVEWREDGDGRRTSFLMLDFIFCVIGSILSPIFRPIREGKEPVRLLRADNQLLLL